MCARDCCRVEVGKKQKKMYHRGGRGWGQHVHDRRQFFLSTGNRKRFVPTKKWTGKLQKGNRLPPCQLLASVVSYILIPVIRRYRVTCCNRYHDAYCPKNSN